MQMNKNGYTKINAAPLSHMVRSKTILAVNKLFDNRAVWQGYPDTLYRIPEAVEACRALKTRIPHEKKAPYMDDLWPIMNIWAAQGHCS